MSAERPPISMAAHGLFRERRLIFFMFALSILFLGYKVNRLDFLVVVIGYGFAFIAYFYWMQKGTYRRKKRILTDALIIRLLLLLAVPLLSDDYFRFIWDGQLQLLGIDPFVILPSAFEHQSDYLSTIYEGLNSQDYYSVYPPVMQWICTLAAWIGGENTLVQLIVMRLFLIAADMGILVVGMKILKQIRRPVSNMALYAFNPLVIVELTGNLHFEGLMLFFSLAAIYLLIKFADQAKGALAGAVFALGVVTKLTNVLLLPPLLRRMGFLRTLVFGLSAAAMSVICFYSFVTPELAANFGSSLDLYFRNFQFNASFFDAAMQIVSIKIPHYTVQTVGPLMSAIAIVAILAVSLIRKSASWREYFVTALFVLFIHLLCASTVHPWYVINLLLISVFTQYRFAVVWSAMVVLSYFMYGNELKEVWWIQFVEYGQVICYFIWEHYNSVKAKGGSKGRLVRG